MFDYMNSVMRTFAKKKKEWKEDLYYAVKVICKKLSKYYAEITPMSGVLLMSVEILDSFRKLRSFRN